MVVCSYICSGMIILFIMEELTNILNKPLVSLTAEEFLRVVRQYGKSASSDASKSNKNVAYGVSDLAAEIGCCPATLYNLKRLGVLDSAILSHIGKKIIFDVDVAREAANNYKKMSAGR